MSRNFTADVDTQREYFNATYFNNSGQNQIARYDTTLLKPFFPNPDQWKLAINRMRVPLSGIPLTKNNIPFQAWQVGLGYTTSKTTVPDDFQAYVPQVNQKTVTHPVNFNMVLTDANTTVYKIVTQYNDLSVWQGTTQINTQGNITPGTTQYDLKSGTTGSIYLYNQTTNSIEIYNALGNALITNITPTDQIQNFCVNITTGDLFIQTVSPDVQFSFTKYARTNNTTWTASTTWQAPDLTEYFSNITICNGYFIAGDTLATETNILGYDLATLTYQFNATVPNLASMNCYGTDSIYIQIDGSNDTFIYKIVGGALVQTGTIKTLPDIFPLGLDNSGNLVLNNSSVVTPTFYAYPANGGSLLYSFQKTITATPIMIYPTTSTITEPVESGPADIFTYQTFLNQINAGFLAAFNKAKNDLGASFLPTQPPEIIYNAQTKLFSLVVEGQYLTTNADGSNQYIVYMNDTLWQQFYFPSTVYSTGFKSIILQNYGINAFVGTGSASLPQFIYIQQEDSTIYSFYDLVRIIVGTTRIPVSGDGEGKTFSNNGTASNNSISMITDIVPDTTTLTPGSVLIYIPAGILRWYNLYAQQPFDKLDLFLQYETKDGNIYPINIVNGEFFSVKLEFKKGPGDF